MLDAYIIEELKRREERRREERRPTLEIPVDEECPEPEDEEGEADPEKDERGVIIIDFGN